MIGDGGVVAALAVAAGDGEDAAVDADKGGAAVVAAAAVVG